MFGGLVSMTVMVKEHVPSLLEPSLTLHVTVVSPTGNADPETRPVTREGAPRLNGQLSVATGVVYVVTRVHASTE